MATLIRSTILHSPALGWIRCKSNVHANLNHGSSLLHTKITTQFNEASCGGLDYIWTSVMVRSRLFTNLVRSVDVQQLRGRLDASLFIYLLICWNIRVRVFLICYHSIASCTSKCDISASAICHLWRFILIYWYIGRPS